MNLGAAMHPMFAASEIRSTRRSGSSTGHIGKSGAGEPDNVSYGFQLENNSQGLINSMACTVRFLNADFNRMSPKEAVGTLLSRLLDREGGRVYFANAHTMVTATRDERLQKALCERHLLLADGSGVRWGSALLGTPLTYNLNGTDLVPALCKVGAAKGLSIYLLGADPGVASTAADKLARAYPGLVIAGARNGYFANDQTDDVLAEIRAADPHLLLVAMGVPKQEVWIDTHADQLPHITCMGVGGLFDFLAERVHRAPLWMRRAGFEWCWRLMMEPGRLWKRYVIGNLVFIVLVATNALSHRPNKS